MSNLAEESAEWW